jgi:hypothetical protein
MALAVAVLRRHWPAALVLAAGAALRAVVIVAYNPLFWFTDTGRYLRYAALGRPDTQRPWGYSGFLRLALHPLSERGVVALQHVLVLACAAVLYAFLVRRGVRPWLGALAIAPLCLSPLVVNVEHHLLSDWQFIVLVSVALVLVSWADARPAGWACAVAGLALGVAVVTRQIALPLVAILVVYLLVRRAGAARVAAFSAAAAAPIVAYLLWMHATYGVYDFTTWSGKMLFARVAPIARCDELGALTAQQRELCDPRPLARRPGQTDYLWTGGRGPQRHLPDRVVLGFARKVIIHQPLAYAKTLAVETAEVFLPGRTQHRGAACVAYWDYPDPLPGGCRTDAVGHRLWRKHPFKVNRPLADGLSVYQHLDAAAGPVLLACLLAVVVAVARGARAGERRLRLDAVLYAVAGLGLILVTMATADFTYRYTLPLYATLPVAAALAVTGLARGRVR